jgi:hypothetical protein
MTLTAEQRSNINRENGKKSQGPKTDAGKARSRGNALKHGLRAEVLALANENPDVIAARADSWNTFYQPASPAAQHLVNECVRATILSDRCHKYHDAALARQVREAEHQERTRDELEIERLVAMLIEQPASAVEGLMRFGAGVAYMIKRWEELERVMETRGIWNEGHRDEAVRLLGYRAEDDQLKNSDVAWMIRLFNLLCYTEPNRRTLGWLMDEKRFPMSLWESYGPNLYPSREVCQNSLKMMVTKRLAELRPHAAELAQSFDIPNRESAADRALILQDEKSAKLFLRYLGESRSSFHRSYKELVQTLERDRAAGAAAPVSDSPNEPNDEAVAEPEGPVVEPSEASSDAPGPDEPAVFPNEPNADVPVEPVLGEEGSQTVESGGVPPAGDAAQAA